MEKKKLDLGNENIYRLLLHLSVPAILSMLVAATYNIVDRIFVGNMNPLGLTAIGITMPFQIVQMAFVLLIGVGSSTLISIKYGEKDLFSAQMLLRTAFKFIIITQILISVLCLIFLDNIFKLLGISEQLYNLSKDYITIILLFGAPSLAGYCLNNSVRALGFSKESMIIVIISSVLNFILDYIFIIVFSFGVKGAAIATVISQSLVTVFVIYFFSEKYKHSPIKLHFSKKNNKNITFADKKNNEKKENTKNQEEIFTSPKHSYNELYYVKEIVNNGLPNFYMQVFATFVNVFYNRSVIKYGDNYHLASITIISSISMFFTMIIYGISQGMQPIVGYNFGAKKPERFIKAFKISTFFVLGISIFGLILIQLFPDFFTNFFTKDENLRNITSANMIIYLFGLPFVGIHSIVTTFLQSIKLPKLSSILYILRYGAILIPTLLILPPVLGVKGIYISNAVSDSLSGVTALVIVIYVIKKKLKNF